MTLGEWLLFKTNQRKVSLRTAALQMGLAHGTLSRVARGVNPDFPDTIVAMAKWGGVSTGFLLHLMGVDIGDVTPDHLARHLSENEDAKEVAEIAIELPPEQLSQLKEYAIFLESRVARITTPE